MAINTRRIDTVVNIGELVRYLPSPSPDVLFHKAELEVIDSEVDSLMDQLETARRRLRAKREQLAARVTEEHGPKAIETAKRAYVRAVNGMEG